MAFYQSWIREHFLNPRNAGESEASDAAGESASLVCGALICFSLKIDPESRIISEAKFKAAGCGVLIAAGSVATEMIHGLTTAVAAQIAQNPESAFSRRLDTVPDCKVQCTRLCCDAILETIRNYSDTIRDEWSGEDALICTCFGVPESAIDKLVSEGNARTVEEVTMACKAGAGCGSCHPLIEDILQTHWLDDYSQVFQAT